MFINFIDFILNFYYIFENKINLNQIYMILKNYCFFFFYIKVLFFKLNNLFFFKYFLLLNIFEFNYIYFNKSVIYGIKFSLSILFLIFIRAGIPRYRYDFLTILGWNRFFFLTFMVFILLLVQYLF